MTITNGYCTLAQVKSELGLTDTNDDTKIEQSVEAASRQIDGGCGQRFWQDATVVTSEFYADSARLCYVDSDRRAGISTSAGLIVKIDADGDGTFETTLTITTDFILLPTNAADQIPVEPWTEIWLADNYYFPRLSNGRPGVQVTAKFGWPAVPDDVEKAAILLSTRLFKRNETSNGVVGFDAMGATVRISRFDPDVAALLAAYRKPAVG